MCVEWRSEYNVQPNSWVQNSTVCPTRSREVPSRGTCVRAPPMAAPWNIDINMLPAQMVQLQDTVSRFSV